jgi:hypothetical protein
MAAVDPARARRLVEESQQYFDHPQMYLFLALGLKSLNREAAYQAFQTGMQNIDRLMKEGSEYSLNLVAGRTLLPLVEQIDPALVPEYFWRVVATRRSIGNPRSDRALSSSMLIICLAWYDRDVAAAIFEPIRAQMERVGDRSLTGWSDEFLGWSIFDPGAAVARLERVPIALSLEPNAVHTRAIVAEMLGLSREHRWRRIWGAYTEMGYLFDRDLR